MKITDFQSGQFEQQLEYSSFCPCTINRQWEVDSPRLQCLLSEADRKLGELNAFSQLIPDINFFIQMHSLKEITASSRIEGTQTNIEEALAKEEDVLPEKRNDWAEVQNYQQSMTSSIAQLASLPISSRLIREAHRLLLQGVRGEQKQPGEFRRSQNWIGATLKDAVYIPPHFSRVNELMSDLENFIHNTVIDVPHLVRIGIVHYQFETIHPFLDGNGRIGRLLITLYLVSSGLLAVPSLYLSDFFERNRTHYFDNLHRTRTHSNLQQWLLFFLSGVIETAESAVDTFKSIITLRNKVEHRQLTMLGNKSRVEKGLRLVQLLYTLPIVSVADICDKTGMDVVTVNRLVKDFQTIGILKEQTGFRRNRKFVFDEYLQLFL